MRWTDDLDEQEKREKCSQDGGLQSDVKMPNLNALNVKQFVDAWGIPATCQFCLVLHVMSLESAKLGNVSLLGARPLRGRRLFTWAMMGFQTSQLITGSPVWNSKRLKNNVS